MIDDLGLEGEQYNILYSILDSDVETHGIFRLRKNSRADQEGMKKQQSIRGCS